MAEIACGVHGLMAWNIHAGECPECRKAIIKVEGEPRAAAQGTRFPFEALVFPRTVSRSPLSPLVEEAFAQDYREACAVLDDSPKASAALSRRCLQNLIHSKEGIKKANLDQEIQAVVASGKLPSYLSEGLDAVRTIGNFAAHPIKSTHTGEVIDVEDGEAEWLLDILEGLFDFYFVQPDILAKKKAALNFKLTEAGKPPLK